MRTGKRTLAGVSAAALGLALVPFVATPAFAATSITSVTLDGPLRAGSGFSQTGAIVGADFNNATQKVLVVANGANPGTLDVTTGADDTITSATAGTFSIADPSAAGSYTVRVCVVPVADSNCNAPDAFQDLTFSTTGAPATVAISPASQTSVPNIAQTYTVTARDASGNLTQLSGSESVVIDDTSTAGSASVDTTNFLTTIRKSGTAPFTASNSAAGTTTLTAIPTGAFFGTPAMATLVTNPVVADDTITLTSPVSTASNEIKVGATSLTFQLERGADDTGTYFQYQVSGTAVDDDTLLAPVGANGTASVTVAVSDDSAINNNTVILTSGNDTLTVTYKTAVPSLTASSPVIVTTPGTTVNLTGTLADQWGDPVPGYVVIGAATAGTDVGTTTSTGSTNAQGNYSVTFLGPTAQDDSTTSVRVQAYAAATPATTYDDTVQIYYTASGTASVTGLTLGTAAVIDDSFASVVEVPFGGTASTQVTGNTGSTGNVVPIRTTTDIASAEVTYSVTGGVLSLESTNVWSGGSASVTASSDDTVYLFSTSVGTATVTATAGGNSLSAGVPIVTNSAAAYNMALSPVEVNVEAGAISTVTLSVTDVFGNPVQTADDSGAVTATASGSILLPGSNLSQSGIVTDANGQAEITFIAASAPGTGVIAVGPDASQTGALAWISPFDPPAGAPAPITSAAAEIQVGPVVETSITLRAAFRDGLTVTARGRTTGYSEGQEVRIRYRAFNEKAQRYTKWRTGAVVEVDANGRFRGTFDQRGLLLVKATIPRELSSNTIEVASQR